MYYSQTKSENVALVEATCPLCGYKATLKFFKHQKISLAWFIPWWSTKNYATCGNCFQTFEVDKELMRQIESAIGQRELMLRQGYCPNCGLKSNDRSKFCTNCGHRLA